VPSGTDCATELGAAAAALEEGLTGVAGEVATDTADPAEPADEGSGAVPCGIPQTSQ
jgi:hypothetical protein